MSQHRVARRDRNVTLGVANGIEIRYTRIMKKPAMPAELEAQAHAVKARVAQNFSAILGENRWSARKAAAALGLTHTYVNSRANGTVEMSGSDLALFADFLDIPIARFFDEHHDSGGNVTSINAKKATKPGSLVPKVGATAKVTQLDEYRHASVAQGIEHWFPVPVAAGSNPAGGTTHLAPVSVIA